MTTNLRAGDRFPDIELPNHQHEMMRLSHLARPCPLCGAQSTQAELEEVSWMAPGFLDRLALADQHSPRADYAQSPMVTSAGVAFLLHHHRAHEVRVFGSWDGWAGPGLVAEEVEPGIWQTELSALAPGTYVYKFLLDNRIWIADPANPLRVGDSFGGWNSVLKI
jgi:hypothetical protein